MSESDHEFEQQLRELKPTVSSDRRAEMLYRAGWAASEQQALSKQQGAALPDRMSRRKDAVRFASGMLCGWLTLAAVAVLYRPMGGQWYAEPSMTDTGDVNQKANASAAEAKAVAASTTSGVSNDVSPHRQDQQEGDVGTRIQQTFAGTQQSAESAILPLSVAARENGNTVVLLSTTSADSASRAGSWSKPDANGASTLSAFPLTRERLEDYL